MPDLEGLWPDDAPHQPLSDGARFRMANGREYVVGRTLLAGKPDCLQRHRIAMTRYIDEHPEDNPVLFTTYNFPQIASRPPMPFSERVRLLGREIVRQMEHSPKQLTIPLDAVEGLGLEIRRACYASTKRELVEMLKFLEDRKIIDLFVAKDERNAHVTLPVSGLIQLEEDALATESDTAFVAMWFDRQMSDAYDDAIAPAIETAGYRPVRIDQKEHNNKIDDEIIAAIRRARFVVADFSCGPDGARGGVYYEAGFAAGLAKPVIYMVRQPDLDRVHFDTRQINHIIWNDIDDLRSRLTNRIEATIGRRN